VFAERGLKRLVPADEGAEAEAEAVAEA
jgi:hypothetical protein